MKYPIKLAVLDMAGTTVRDMHEVEACFAKAAKQTGLDVTEQEILAAQGWSKRFVFETFWEKQLGSKSDQWKMEVEHSYQVFTQILEHHYETAPIFPSEGCLDLFDYLSSQKVAICLTTGFYRKVCNIILSRLGWNEGLNENYFGKEATHIQMSITSDEVPAGRPAPDMIYKAMKAFGIESSEQVMKIGDTPSDLKAGRAASCGLVLAVTNGTHSEDQLKDFDHDLLIPSILHARDVLEGELQIG
ncbi:MAG: HAD family hydrolase [Bacteroidota bacterium]